MRNNFKSGENFDLLLIPLQAWHSYPDQKWPAYLEYYYNSVRPIHDKLECLWRREVLTTVSLYLNDGRMLSKSP